MIKKTLELAFRSHDDAWWGEGVPEQIRVRCSDAKERNTKERLHSYCYTNFIDFKDIIKDNWAEFSKVLPTDIADGRKKQQLLADLQQVNEIRNGVMHPIKGIRLSEKDCEFVRKLACQWHESRWRPPVRHMRFGTK